MSKKSDNSEEYIVSEENPSVHLSSCHKCERRLKIECYSDNFTREEGKFMGAMGIETITYCPYCGVQGTGFRPYDDDRGKFDFEREKSLGWDDDDEDDEYEDEWDDEDDGWWPDAPGVELVDEDEESDDETDDEGEDPWEMSEDAELFECPSCGESFKTSRKGCDKIFCYYCGKKIPSAVKNRKSK